MPMITNPSVNWPPKSGFTGCLFGFLWFFQVGGLFPGMKMVFYFVVKYRQPVPPLFHSWVYIYRFCVYVAE